MEKNIEISEIEKQIREFFVLCKKTNVLLQSIDIKVENEAIRQVQKKSAELFMSLENYVNPMNIKDFKKVSYDEKLLVTLHYMILKCLYLYYLNDGRYSEDMRSAGSSELSVKIMKIEKFDSKFGDKKKWYNNDKLFLKGIIRGLNSVGVHPTLMQNIVRYLSNTILLPEYRNQDIFNYMMDYLKAVSFYLVDGPSQALVYLDYI